MNVMSVTKSITFLLIDIALDKGFIFYSYMNFFIIYDVVCNLLK